MSQESADIYVSYARKDPASQKLVKKLHKRAEKDQRKLSRQSATGELETLTANIRYDEEELHFGDSILAFMDDVARAEHLILLISDPYLRSPYCLYECLSAYNAIGNRYRPAIVFVNGQPRACDALLDFDDKGLPVMRADRFERWWQDQREALKIRKPRDPAIPWCHRFARMAPEFNAWLVGRRWSEAPDHLMLPWPVSSRAKAVLGEYIERALHPVPNRSHCPSSDQAREESVATITGILNQTPAFEKRLNQGHALANDEEWRRFVAKMLDENPAEFVSQQLASLLRKLRPDDPEAGQVRESADQLFGELVRYGIRIDTLHYQLQEMNQKHNGGEPNLVASESMIPEMADAYLRERRAAFRRVREGNEESYIGRREFVVSDQAVLEIDETARDAIDQLSDDFLSRAADLFYTSENGHRRRKPGPELLREGMQKRLKSQEFILKIEIDGMTRDQGRALARKLKENKVLRDVPMFLSASEQDNVIKTSSDWYDAVFDYYEARNRSSAT